MVESKIYGIGLKVYNKFGINTVEKNNILTVGF